MNCSKCEKRMECKDSRPTRINGYSTTRRRYQCPSCMHRITTMEFEDHMIDDEIWKFKAKRFESQLIQIRALTQLNGNSTEIPPLTSPG